MSKSVINSSQNAPFYSNFLKSFRGSMPPDPLDSLRDFVLAILARPRCLPHFIFQNLTCLNWTLSSLNLDTSTFANRDVKIKTKMANSVDHDEIAHYELSHLDLHCLQRDLPWSTGLKGLDCKLTIGVVCSVLCS